MATVTPKMDDQIFFTNLGISTVPFKLKPIYRNLKRSCSIFISNT